MDDITNNLQPLPTTPPEDTSGGGGGGGWFGAVMGIISPKQAAPTGINQPQPISEAQQKQNRILFFVAAIVLIATLGVFAFYILKQK
jgi:hypothetical protein